MRDRPRCRWTFDSPSIAAWSAMVILGALLTARPAAAQASSEPIARLEGTVFDSVAQRPLAGALVRLVRADDPTDGRSTGTDSIGRFIVDSLRPGRWLATFLHPVVDSLGLEPSVARLDVREAGTIALTLATRSVRALIAGRCGPAVAADAGLGVVYGVVRRADDDVPVAGARVALEWPEWVVQKRAVRTELQRVEIVADTLGRWAACGVPADATVRGVASFGPDSTGALALTIPASRWARQDLRLGHATVDAPTPAERDASNRDSANPGRMEPPTAIRRGNALVRGTVADQNGRPVAGAIVRLLGTGAATRSDDAGAFAIARAPAGTQTLDARAIGLQPARRMIELRDGSATAVSLVLAPQTVLLDTVRVMAGRNVPGAVLDLERRWRTGTGVIMNAETIRQRSTVFLTDALRGIPGVRTLMAGGYGHHVLMRNGAGRECLAMLFVDGVRVDVGGGWGMVLDDYVGMLDAAAVEVYPRPSMMPAEYLTFEGCGAVVVWTRARFGGVEPRSPREARRPR